MEKSNEMWLLQHFWPHVFSRKLLKTAIGKDWSIKFCQYQIFKGYCTSSRINCGMAKSLALARACEGLLADDLAIPQLILELVQ